MEGFWLVSHLAVWLLVLALAVVVVSLLRNVGVLAAVVKQLQSGVQDTLLLEAGMPAPELPLTTLAGQATELSLYKGAPKALLFVSPGCGPCHDMLQALERGEPALPELPSGTTAVLVSLGDATATQGLMAEVPFTAGPVLLVDPTALQARWGVRSTPTIVLLDAEGRYLRHQIGFTPLEPAQEAATAREKVPLQV